MASSTAITIIDQCGQKLKPQIKKVGPQRYWRQYRKNANVEPR